MNKIVASVGLAALSASALQSVNAQGVGGPAGKPWSVSASLRGFYDDNVNTVSSGASKQSVYGIEVSPGIDFNWANDQNTLKAGYRYSLRVYDHKPLNNTEKYDQEHTFLGEWDHAFSERFSTAVRDSFVVGQEPDIRRATSSGALTDFQRLPGDNIRNYGTIMLNAQLTPVFGVEAGYANVFFDYHDEGAVIDPFPFIGLGRNIRGRFVPGPSLSGSSDRIENSFHVDGRWSLSPSTIALVGYQFRQVNYTGDEPIAILTSGTLMSEGRDSRSHYGYGGLEHKFLPNFTGSVKAGATFTDYYNDPNNSSDVSPYVSANLRYTYAVESYLEAGFNYDRNATDLVSASGNGFTLDQQSAVLFASIHHRILPRLHGSITGQYQHSTFNGGPLDSNSDNYYLLGLNLQYQFNPYLSTEIGYNYDKVDSDVVGRGFDRNRVYIGVTARY